MLWAQTHPEVAMTWKRSMLVVANVTAASDELLAALKLDAEREETTFTLIVPATASGGGRAAAQAKLDEALARMRTAGLHVDGAVGDGDPLEAVTEAWDPKRYDQIIVSTLPLRLSKWLHAGLPERIEKLTGAPVLHVVSQPPRPPTATVPAPHHERDAMGPLSVLGWGTAKHD
jgi:GABA permease